MSNNADTEVCVVSMKPSGIVKSACQHSEAHWCTWAITLLIMTGLLIEKDRLSSNVSKQYNYVLDKIHSFDCSSIQEFVVIVFEPIQCRLIRFEIGSKWVKVSFKLPGGLSTHFVPKLQFLWITVVYSNSR